MSTTHASLHVRQRHRPWRVATVLGLSLPIFAWVASHAPLPQDLTYHDFADQRVLLGLPHFWNVASNLPFALIGLLGCWWLIREGRESAAFADPNARVAYFVFFVGEILTCFGSGYYHAGPTNDTLVWDRLVFSLMLTSTFTIIVAEFVSCRVGRVMLAPMVGLGLFSVLYWARSEAMGQGDLRLYYLVQYYPMLAIPVILLLFRSRYTHAGAFWAMWALYAAAKAAELYDGPIFEWGGFWSGHTVKHLIAAGASYLPLYGLQHRTNRPSRSEDCADSHNDLAGTLPIQAVDSLLSRLTYGAMAMWGAGEVIDSIPGLIQVLGFTFMVYSGALWFLALLTAVGSSIPLMVRGPTMHRRRIVTWYFLLVLVGASASAGETLHLTAQVIAAAMPMLWLVRAAWHRHVDLIAPIATVALIALACSACGESVRAVFIQPRDGATVQNPVRLEFGAEGIEIAAIRPNWAFGEIRPGIGHYHLAIDADCVSTRFTGSGRQTIPHAVNPRVPALSSRRSPWIHLDDGSNIVHVQVPTGSHRLTLQIGDDMDFGQGLCSTISVNVAE